MRITALELHNIKSYADPVRIDLTHGVNAICGSNGSGKTTVLEAIGFALFDFLPYPQAAFLREGQKWGTVRLTLLGRDGREYEIVRRVGSGATHFVADAETGTRIAERKDTLTWIREKALGLDGEGELAALFKNAIGVPQGLMTADFQGAPGTRKAIFDPLLRVEEYRQAYEYLRDTMGYLRERSAQIDGEIEHLRHDVEAIPERERERAGLHERMTLAKERLGQLLAEKAALEARLATMEAVEARLRKLEADLAAADYNAKRLADRVSAATDALREAEQAREIVTAAEPGHRLVVQARQRLEQLNTRREERDRLQGELQGAQAERKGIFEQVEKLERQLHETEEAATAAAGLVEAAGEQARLEQSRAALEARLKSVPDLDRRVARLQEQVDLLQRDCDGREIRLTRGRAAESQVVELPAAQAALDEITGLLAQLDPLRRRQEVLRDEGKALRSEHDRLHHDVERLSGLRARLTAAQAGLAGVDGLILRQRALSERQAHLAASLAYQMVARQELEQAHCPLLDLVCPAVSTDRALVDRLAVRESELTAEESVLRDEIAGIEAQATKADALREEVRSMEVEEAGLVRSEAELPRAQERLDACREEYANVTGRLADEATLRERRLAAQSRVENLQAEVRVAAEVKVLKEQQERDLEVMRLQSEERARLEEERAELTRVEAEASELGARLDALGDPRARQQRLLALAGQKQAIERSREEQQKRLADAAGRVKAYVGALQGFEGIDGKMAAERAQESAHSEAYERYLQYRGLAGEADARATVLAETERELAEATRIQAELVRERETAASGYDAEAHAQVRADVRLAGEESAVGRSRLAQIGEQLSSVERELADLKRKAETLRRREGERDELVLTGRAIHFIRETIKSAGPAVTDSLLRNISAGANEIFAEIMDDHAAELRWDRDYEVLVQRGAETRKFAQLSGGEQMSAALAVRLALLKEMSQVDFAFFDEPTQNMDTERRSNLAGQISQVKGFDQLIVISHDDTFEHHTDTLIRLEKQHEETRVQID